MLLYKLGDLLTDIVSLGVKLGCGELDEVTDHLHIVLVKASGGYRGSTYSYTAGNEGLLGIVGDSVLVNGDIYLVELLLKSLTGDTDLAKINEAKNYFLPLRQ